MRRIRDPILVLGLAFTLAVAAVVCASSLSWIGRTFPGFLVMDNRVVASAGLAHWPAARSGSIYQQELVSVAGEPLRAARDLPALLDALPRDEPVEYRLHSGGHTSVWHDVPRTFTVTDYFLLHGTLIFCGIGLAGIALAIRFLRGSDRVADATSLSLLIVGLYALTAADLYGPYRFFRVHAFLECLLYATAFHYALVFPQPVRLLGRAPWIVQALYGSGFLLAAFMQVSLYDPAAYALLHRIAVNAFALALLAFIARQVHAFLRPPSFDARQRVKVVALGTVAALVPQVGIMLVAATSGGRVPENLMSFSGMLFPISLSYAVLRQDLFGVDIFLRRTLNYALLTGLVGAAYVGLVVGLDFVFPGSDDAGALRMLSGAIIVVALLPLRDRVQNTVDRLFFRSAYDFRRLIETTSSKLASVRSLSVIAEELERPLRESFEPEFVALDVRRGPGGALERVLDAGAPPALDAAGVWSRDLPEEPLELEGGGLAVPFRVDGRLVALLTLGRRRSGRFYGGDDRRLLQTLANQGAVAFQNAIALETLADMNRSLEEKVATRTGELARTL
ncbi:MAG: GAF domain-containing protein, partial [Myxococcota bacterium]